MNVTSISKYLTNARKDNWTFIIMAAGVGFAGSLFGLAFAPLGC